jgi:hypothetical protein
MDSQELSKLTEQITTNTGESAININQSFVATIFLIFSLLMEFYLLLLFLFLYFFF